MDFSVRSVNVSIPSVSKFKNCWLEIYTPMVNILDVEVRMNLTVPCIDIRTGVKNDQVKLEMAESFVQAIVDGFTPQQALPLLKSGTTRLQFHISEIKRLSNDSTSRAIGRIIGREGKVKLAIENTFHISMIIKDDQIFLIGDNESLRQAKESISRLVLGAHPGSILNKLKVVASKQRKGYFETVYLNDERKEI
ncbi:putative RNA-binding protein Pno1p interacting with Nob1p and involved in 26S proteasome assembly [Pseudoloma neurophilia]|uniref:Pre-rRNA-processing protein PNO1 n=1 Tax=Pseudoloma neurophilia TaxID=146866 RepID=A0A0R0LV80_9MICR|nr:putative RNA-binding protein Pno1p interacting with Nob1p and involved in 26S proteasome assembly [Pseudoloma neurophilia]